MQFGVNRTVGGVIEHKYLYILHLKWGFNIHREKNIVHSKRKSVENKCECLCSCLFNIDNVFLILFVVLSS